MLLLGPTTLSACRPSTAELLGLAEVGRLGDWVYLASGTASWLRTRAGAWARSGLDHFGLAVADHESLVRGLGAPRRHRRRGRMPVDPAYDLGILEGIRLVLPSGPRHGAGPPHRGRGLPAAIARPEIHHRGIRARVARVEHVTMTCGDVQSTAIPQRAPGLSPLRINPAGAWRMVQRVHPLP